MLAAIKKEIFIRKDELQNKELASLYFGGGTPSILTPNEISSLINEVLKYFSFQNDIEITLEANPDDLEKKFLQGLKNTGINRLSIGTQSFFDEDLKLMNRAHNASEAESSIKRAQDFGFENISIDLIYGSPISDFEVWKKNLQKTVYLGVPHISSYALTVEPKTALQNFIDKKKISAPDETMQNEEFFYMAEVLKNSGFEHYEISNFAKPGFRSRHNSAYWEYREYLGIGPSAHSYDGGRKRSWNLANNTLYIRSLSENKVPLETEILSEKERFNEMLMIGLRTAKGVDFHRLQSTFPEEIFTQFSAEMNHKISEGILVLEDNFLKIPEKHWFLADGIAADLFVL